MYTCIIVDDQSEAINLIGDHVSKIPALDLLLMTTDSVEALAFLDHKKPDIIFLDIEMPEITGIEFIKNIRSKWGNSMPKIVFTTGHADYALSGYEHGVIDYLLKPITFCRFKQCTDRIIDELERRSPHTNRQEFFFAEDNGNKVRIKFDEIICIEGAGNYITIYSNDCNKTIYKSMNAMNELLPCDKFFRVHKSFIVAFDKIISLRGNELLVRIRSGEKNIPIGITYKENVLKQLGLNR
jgi:DNA-binding LytR/AlgR family response regulator